MKRFIIIDEIETFNLIVLLYLNFRNQQNNFFILINNKSRTLLETVKSRLNNINLNFKMKNKI